MSATPLKILLVNDLGAHFGGAEMLTLALRDGLRERGHDARIFASSVSSDVGPNEADYSCFGTFSRWRTLNRSANLSAPLSLHRALRDFQPDVVHVRMFLSQLSPLILPLLRDVPTLYHATWYETICPLGFKLLPDKTQCRHEAGKACYQTGCLPARDWAPLMLQMNLVKRWRSAFDLVVANSEWVRRQLEAAGFNSVEVAWNGVPIAPPRAALTSPPTITCAGRLSSEKGIDVLIRAFAGVVKQLPDAQLLIAGAGPEQTILARLIDELALAPNAQLLGHLDTETMESAFQAGWVHCVPTLCAETFGLTAAEAMMRGTAVVASRTGGLAEIIAEEESGTLVDPGDVAALRDALLGYLCDSQKAEDMGRKARARAQAKMDQGRWIDRFVEFYRVLDQGESAIGTPIGETK